MDVSNALAPLVQHDNHQEGDYRDDNGFLMCGKCHTLKQAQVPSLTGGGTQVVPVTCECREKELAQEKEEMRRQAFEIQVEALRRDGLTDPEYRFRTFATDNRQKPEISDGCHRYVDRWDAMRADNVGLLFYGDVGTGKSFYACCIANALLNKGVPALVTSFPRILNKLQNAGWNNDRKDLLDRLQRNELVVIDDLGVERETDYAMEQIFAVIDARYRSGKPLIVTTNLAPGDMRNAANIGHARIYDRIMQNCLKVHVPGPSRRLEIARKKRKQYQELLGL